MKKHELPAWEFWFAVIGGISLTMVYFFDFKTGIMTRITGIEKDVAFIRETLSGGEY